ncbi:MAG: tetratricopeptide repeat protein [Planctomycetota bacterium]
MRDLIQARLHDLTEEQRELLDVAACCGFSFDPELVADVVGMAPIPALRAFGRIENAHRLVRSVGRRFAFDHHQVQEALYDATPALLRERYHAAIARALETRSGLSPEDMDGALCVELCEHFLKGAAGTSAIPYLRPALHHLEAGYLNDQAIGLARTALDVEGLLEGRARLEVLLAMDGPLHVMGRAEQQEETIMEARALAEALGDEALLARVVNASGVLHARTDRAEAACADFERSRELYAALGDREHEANALNGLAMVSYHLGRHAEAREHFEHALRIQVEIGDKKGEATVRGNLGGVLVDLGLAEEAAETHRRSLALCEEIGDRLGMAIASGNIGNDHLSAGRVTQARDCYERAIEGFRETGYRHGEALGLANVGELLAGLGRTAEAAGHLTDAHETARELGDARLESMVVHRLAIAAAQDGRIAEAERLYRNTLALCERTGFRAGTAMAQLALGELLLDSGRAGDAKPLLDEALVLARAIGMVTTEVLLLCQLATLPGGDAAAAQEAFAKHEGQLSPNDRMEARLLLWQATRDPGHLAAAKHLLDDLVASTPDAYRRTLLESVTIPRKVREAAAAAGIE